MRYLLLTLALFTASVLQAEEALPKGAKVASLSVSPSAVNLDQTYAYSQLVVTAKLDSGDIVDVTRMMKWTAPKPVTITPAGQVRPTADGTGELTGEIAGQKVTVPVVVKNAKVSQPVSFVKDVQPALSKMGCNQGTCHGGAQGKNGFKLSLRGYDPIYDHRALTDDIEGRRFNRAAPERSLMLLKPIGAVPHVGGVTMQPGEPYYELVKQWIAEGVKQDLSATRVAKIEMFPKDMTIPMPGMKQQFNVIATYADGSKRDVSAEAFLESSNTETLTVDRTGLATSVRRGETTILARYEGAYAASTVITMGDRSGFTWKQLPVQNYIDAAVDAKLQKVKITPSDMCNDADFIRRVSIDLTGLPPTPEAVRAFLADTKPSQAKRDALVDKLVGSPAYIEHWTNKWADLLQVNRKFLGDQGATKLQAWIRNAIATNMPYDKFAYEVLTAAGSNIENPPASYYKVLRTPDAVMENTTQLFLAIRFNCNKCHDHPFEKWTQDQYYELAAYFSQVGRAEDPKFKGQKIGGSAVEGAVPLAEVISDAKAGEIKHDRTGQNAKPKFPFVHASAPNAEAARRTQLAQWLTSKDNPYFAKSYANRLWSYLLGVGIIEPVDDIRAGNPPTNPELLEKLSKQFIDSGFNTNELVKTICKSRTYQLSITTNPFNKDDDINYSRAMPRRLPAEVLFDSIHAATGSQSRLPGLPPGARAVQLLDSNVDLPGGFLELFGKPVRESACECERSNTMMLGPVLAMVNGPIVSEAIRDPNGKLSQFTAKTKDDAKVVEEIYFSVLNRAPTASEIAGGIKAIQSAKPDFDRLTAEYARRKKLFDDYESTLNVKQAAWEKMLLDQKPTTWNVLELKNLKATSGATFTKQADGSYLVSGKSTAQELYTFGATVPGNTLTALRLEVMSDPSLPAKGPGRAVNGNLVLNEFKVNSRPLSKKDEKPKPVALSKPEATFAQGSFPIENAIDNNPATGWALADQLGRNHTAIFQAGKLPKDTEGVELNFSIDQRFGTDHNIGRFRISATTDKAPRLTSSVPADMIKMLETPIAERKPDVVQKLRDSYLNQDQEHRRLKADLSYVPPTDARVLGAQDLIWALINSPAFLFNR
ncbi:MAG: DUF1549 domain-containing protein [Fimbriiglobus sp.]